MDYKKRLVDIYAAIIAIEEGAQEYSVGTRKVRKADLSLLYKERDFIEEKIKIESGCESTFVASFYQR